MAIDEIVSIALLGTRGAPARLPPLPDELAKTLPSTNDSELQLLDMAAAATLFWRAGTTPEQGVVLPAPSPEDRWEECTEGASHLLEQAFERRLQPLLIEWLDLATSARRRPPHLLLPKLLDCAVANKALRARITAIIDERGRWLTQFNPSWQWQFTNQSSASTDDLWNTGNLQQRAEVLLAIRASDPAKARELALATWKYDGADERTRWVECLLPNLSDADEDFLETCLDDRSSRVRDGAADLLGRLPNSKFVSRMIERIRPLVAFTSGSAGQLLKLKRATPASIEIKLPDTFDKTMQRDGISEKPNEIIGLKQWWLLQIIAKTPLSYWTDTFDTTPSVLIEALPGDFATIVLRGWLEAMTRAPLAEWIEPLVTAAKSEIRIDENVLQAVPSSQRVTILRAMIKGSASKGIGLPGLFKAWHPVDETVSQTLIDEVEARTLLVYEAYFHLHPNTLPQFESKLSQQEMPEYRNGVDQALSVITLRRSLIKEFS